MSVIKENKQIERIEVFKPKLTKSRQKLVLRESKSKSITSLISSRIALLRKDHKNSMNEKIYSPNDLILLLNMLQEKNREFKQIKDEFVEIEIIEGWKKKGGLDVFPTGFEQDFKIVQRIRDKKTGKIKETHKIIPFENVNKILKHILTWKKGETRMCYDFTELLGEKTWQDVIGKRTKVYFPFYYFPIKVLEELGFIDYGGNGEIKRLI